MAAINVGYNFSMETFHLIKELNEGNGKNHIASVYGSDIEHTKYSARPDYRIPEHVTFNVLQDHISLLSTIGVKFWYTANTISIGAKKDIDVEEITNLVRVLANLGAGIIVADPLLIDIIHSIGINISIELSTIMRIESPRQLIAFKEQYPYIIKMVMHISYNRSFYLLKQFVKAGISCGIEIEVLANELCGSGYSKGATPCIQRDRCYALHATTKTLEEAKSFKNYPFNKCVGSRYTDVSRFLNLFWILPQDFDLYSRIGISSFKLTGRTASDEFMEFILPQYIAGKYEGDIARLWKSIESINTGKNESTKITTLQAEDVKDFLQPFANEDIECHSRICNLDCTYCPDFEEKYL